MVSFYGKVSSSMREYPVSVDFPNINVTNVEYTSDGKFYSVGNRVLFFSEPKVEAATVKPSKSKLIGKQVALIKSTGTSILGTVTAEDAELITINTLDSKATAVYSKDELTAIYELSDTNYNV